MNAKNEPNFDINSKETGQFILNKLRESIASLAELENLDKAKHNIEIEENELNNNKRIQYSKEDIRYFGKDSFDSESEAMIKTNENIS